MNKHNKTPYSEAIAKKVEKLVRGGVSIKVIMGAIAHLQHAPTTFVTFKKLYGGLVEQTKADMIEEVGSVVIKAAKEGDMKAAEFFLRSKGGWSPNSTVNEVEQEEDPDENSGAIDSLMTLLGKSRGDTDKEE